MAVTNKKQLRKKQDEEEKKVAEATNTAAEEQSPAQVKGPSAPVIEKTDKGATAHIGPTNRPMTQDQSFKLNQRKAVRETPYEIVETGKIGQLPEVLEPHREMLQRKNDVGDLMASSAHPWAQNKIKVNTSNIKSETQLFYFGSTLADKASVEALYKDYAKRNGLKVDDLYYRAETALGANAFYNQGPKSNMGKLGSLYDRNGDAININTASPELVEQGIRGTGDSDERKAKAKAFYALCRTKGSRFYGYVPSDDLEVFRDSATLTQSGFNSAQKEYKQLFKQGSDSRDYNETAYAAKREWLETTDTLDALSRITLVQELDRAYRDVTGMAPPEYTSEKSTQPVQEKTENEPEEQKGFAERFLADPLEALGSLFGLGGQTPDAPEALPTPMPQNTPKPVQTPEPDTMDEAAPKLTDANGNAPVLMASASPTTPPVARETAANGNEQDGGSDTPEDEQGPVYRPSDGAEQETNAEPVKLNTMSDAYGLLRQGRADLLPDYARRYLDALGKSSGVRMLWGEMDEEGMQQVKTGNEPAEYREMLSMARLGTTIASAMADVKSQDFPEELRNEAMMVLTGIVYSADQAVRSGQIVPREGVSLYEDYLNAYPKARERVQSIYDGWKALLEDKAELDAQRQKDGEQFARDAREAVASGVYSDAQYASVLENSNVKDADVYQAMYATPFINEFEYIYSDYFTEGGGFDQSLIKTKLNADGVKDDMDYRFALRDSMNALYYEDAKMAVTLGMSVEDYYARMGGMTVEQLAQRANRRMQAQAQIITQEDIDALSTPYGEGVGAWTATTEAVKRGGNALLTMFADTLYVGKNALTMERTASAMRATYQGEWGVFGRDQYRRDMEALIKSGDLDERYAKALRDALDTAGDVYDIGIDPRDMGGVISFAGDRRRAVEQSDTLMRTKGTQGENRWYMLLSSTVTNTGMMAASTAVGAVAGPVAGFSVGYGLPNYSERVYERLGEGYTLQSANALAAYDTAGMVAANVATFSGIFGELSGAGALERLGYLTSMKKNASGLVKFKAAIGTFFKTFAENEIDEAVKDPIKEGMTQRFIDNAIAPLYRKMDSGEDVSASDVVISIASALTPAALVKTAKDTLVDTVKGAPEEAAYSVLFSLAGAGGETFHSVRMANDVLSGKSMDIGAVMDAVVEDAKDPAFAEHIDEAAKQNRMDEKTVEAIVSGVGEEDRQTAARERAKETEYREKEAAAAQASDGAKQRYQDVRERVLVGEVEADVELENALDQWGKAETARQEAHTAAQTAGEKAEEAETRMLDACRADASARVRAETESARKRAQRDVQTRVDILLSEAKDLREQSDAMNEEMVAAYERGATMDELDGIATNAGLLLIKAMELEEQAAAMQRGQDTDKAQAAMDAAQAKVDAAEAQANEQLRADEEKGRMQEELTAIRQALSSVQGSRAKRIYLNDKQKAEVLAKTGLRSIAQVNSRYGTKFRVRMENADMALDGNFYMEMAGQSGSLLDADSAHPESDLLDLMDRAAAIDRNLGMQASVGDGRKAEGYLPETVSRGTLDPVTQKLASHLKQKTGLELIVMPLANNIRGLYDRKNGRLILSGRIGAGEVMRQVVMHELTHYIEGTSGYVAYEDAALEAAYRGNEDALERDANELRQRYTEAGVAIEPDDVHRELVAAATEKLLSAVGAWGRSGSETLVYDLLGVKQSFPVRLYNKLSQFLAGRRAKKTGAEAVQNYNALVTARDNLKKAISDAGMWTPGKGGQDTTVELDSAKRSRMEIDTESEQTRMQYALVGRAENGKGIYKSNFPPNTPQNVKRERIRELWQSVWAKKPIELYIERNGQREKIVAKFDPTLAERSDLAKVMYGNKKGNQSDQKKTLSMADDLYQIAEESKYNYSKPADPDKQDNPAHYGVTEYHYFINNLYIEDDHRSQQPYVMNIDVKERDDGDFFYSFALEKGHKKEGHPPAILSGDAAQRASDGLEETQRTGEHRSVPHSRRAASLSDTSVQQTETDVNAYSMQDGTQFDIAPRQFGNKTVQRADAISDQVKQLLEGDTYETITNDAMIRQANERVDRDGIDSVVRDLAGKENWTPEDTASALVSMVRASNEDMLTHAAMIGMELNRRGTEAGQKIQLYSVLKKLTPAGAIMEMTKTANKANRKKGVPEGNIPVGNQPPVKRTGNGTGNGNGKVRSGKSEKTGKKTNDEITAPETRSEDLPDVNKRVTTTNQSDVERVRMGEGDAVQGTFIEAKFPEKLEKAYNRADAIKTELDNLPQDVSWDNPWNLPLNPAQMELINRFGLMGTKLPGENYSVASLKQRMLCAIIATPNNVRGDGLLTLCQQLEAMKAGYAVVTEADLNYINGQMSTYLYAEGPEHDGLPVTTEGKMALSRVYDAQANTVQAGKLEQLNSFGYTNMLSSTKTWVKNFASNMMIRPLELASEKIGGVIEEKLVTPKTGNRTTDAPNRAERAAGKEAFNGEIGQTMVDYFVTHADTGHGNGFDLNRKGRTFNKGPFNEMLNAYKNIVDFAMQIGDRPFWEQCYTEELAVIKRLGMKIADTRKLPDGRTVDGMRDMTLDEMKKEAVVRATERVFQEDNSIVNAINNAKKANPAMDLMISTTMPFVKTPTNVGMRMVQYSPVGLARAILQYGLWDGKRNNEQNFDQRKFVMNLGRGVTGTGMMLFGMTLAASGMLLPGYEDEENKDRRTIRKGMGESYSPYLKLGDMEIPIDFAQPASGPLYIGAKIAWAIDQMEDVDARSVIREGIKASAFETGDQLFNNSFLSGLSALLRGYGTSSDFFTTGVQTVLENQASRMTPSMIRAIAKWSDPYVRDTASQNWMHQFVNEQVVQNYPGLRHLLPVKTDVTGDRTLQSGYYNWGKEQQNAALHMLNSFALPMNAIGQKNDDTLDALLDLSYRTGQAGFLPGELIASNKYELNMNKTTAKKYGFGDASVTMHLTDEEKREANRAYGDLLFNGDGGRYYTNGKGVRVPMTGLRVLMKSEEWNAMDDDERMKRVSDEASKAKELIIVQTAKQKKEAGEL